VYTQSLCLAIESSFWSAYIDRFAWKYCNVPLVKHPEAAIGRVLIVKSESLGKVNNRTDLLRGFYYSLLNP